MKTRSKVGERIITNWRQLGLKDHPQANILAEVCRGHRPKKENGVATWSDFPAVLNVAPDRSVRVRVVSALVYAADELHIGADRAPLREQEAAQIENEESARHWARHQAINGPSLRDGRLCFDCRPSTLIAESDLRSKVLHKAFSAVRDAQNELAANGLKGKLPDIGIAWNRVRIWELLMLEALSESAIPSADDLRSKVRERFANAHQKLDSLDGLCIDETQPADESRELDRTIGGWQTSNYIVREGSANSDAMKLDFGKDAISRFFTITSEADEADILFAGRYSGHHQFNLLKSPFGSEFADKVLMSLVRERFGVSLAKDDAEEPVRHLVRTSPSAARLILNFAPSASVLVQRHLLRSMVLTGATLDTLRVPELMLNRDFRSAITRLSEAVSAGQSKFLELIDELAIVGGYEYDHAADSMIPSEATQKEFED